MVVDDDTEEVLGVSMVGNRAGEVIHEAAMAMGFHAKVQDYIDLLAYSDSADAHYNLADAYLKDGQKDLARKYAEEALALLDSHAAPLSSWSDTEQRRDEIRRGIQDTLKKIGDGK